MIFVKNIRQILNFKFGHLNIKTTMNAWMIRLLVGFTAGVSAIPTLSYIQNPTSSQMSLYTPQSCSGSDSSTTCCGSAKYFFTKSWYDQTLGVTNTFNYDCYYLTSSHAEWVHIRSTGMPQHPYATPSSVTNQTYNCTYFYLIKSP